MQDADEADHAKQEHAARLPITPRLPLTELPSTHWQCASGALIPVATMSGPHIERTLALLRRWAQGRAMMEAIAATRYGGLGGEELANDLSQASPSDFARLRCPPYATMERRLRKLATFRPTKGAPMQKITLMLVGAHFRPPATQILEWLSGGAKFVLVPDPENQYDAQAIRACLDPREIPTAYLPTLREICLPTGKDYQEFTSEPMFLGFVANSAKTVPEGYTSATELAGLVATAALAFPLIATLAFTAEGKPCLTVALVSDAQVSASALAEMSLQTESILDNPDFDDSEDDSED